MKIKKSEIIRIFSIKSKFNKIVSARLVNRVFWALCQVLIHMQPGDKLEIRGLGVFEMRKLQGRFDMLNVNDGQRGTFLPRRKLYFRVSKSINKELKKL